MSRPDRHASKEELDAAIEADWNEFWLPLLSEDKSEIHAKISDKLGVVIMSSEMLKQIKTELYDIHILRDHITETYMYFSEGAVSKPLTLPREVFAIADENRIHRQDLKDFLDRYIEENDDSMVKYMRDAICDEFSIKENQDG